MMDLGFKIVTLMNWNLPDAITLRFAPLHYKAEDKKLSEHPFLSYILEPSLSVSVPADIHKLFEVARGAMVYAYYFYPMFTLSLEQLFRVGEAAVTHRCRLLNPDSKDLTFNKGIRCLQDTGCMDQDTANRWHALRQLRNSASHPDRQSIIVPGEAIGLMARLADDINDLFSSE